MLFSIVIPTYNNLDELRRCLAALDRLENRDFEVLVGVDGSTDGTRDFLESYAPKFPFYHLYHPGGVNQGRSATRNLALGQLSGKYTLFLDSDMEAAPDLLARLASDKRLMRNFIVGLLLFGLVVGGLLSIGVVWSLNRLDLVNPQPTFNRE